MNRSQFLAAVICAVVFEGSLSPIHGQAPSRPAPAPAAVPVVPLKLPLTYVSAQTRADQLQLNADKSFSLQEAGQTYHGTFSVNGNTLELRISETNTNTTAAMQGSNLTDSSGQTWVLREQPARPAPVADVVKNQDVISLVKAGLDDEIVIAKIGSSKCQFDTSPEALIQLRQSGVSAAVIKAMAGSRTPPATSGGAASTLPAATPGVPFQAGSADASLSRAARTSPNPPGPAPSIQPSSGPTQVTGRVVWDGIPVPNALVQLWRSGDHNSIFKLASTVSAADGTFTMQEPPTGRLNIGAVGPSPDYGNALLYPVTIVAGQPKNVGTLYVFKKLQLLSPANSATMATTAPTLQWTEFPGTARYEVRVFNSATQQLVFSRFTQSTQITVSPALQSGQKYQWDVYAHGSRTAIIANSSGWYFTIHSTGRAPTVAGVGGDSPLPPRVPTPLTSADGSVFNRFPRTTAPSQAGSADASPNAEELAALKRLGGRNYFEFKLGKTEAPQRVGDITLLLKGTDPKKNKYTIEVYADDKLTAKKDKNVNEPVQVYTSTAREPSEIVVYQVQKDLIVGYLAVPKERIYKDVTPNPPAPTPSIEPSAGPRLEQLNKTTSDLRPVERIYTEIKLGMPGEPRRFGDVTLRLNKVNPETNTYSVRILVGDKVTLVEDKRINELVQFYAVKSGGTPYDLIINQITNDGVFGYLWRKPPIASNAGKIATHAQELAVLKRLGERNYTEFKLPETKAPQRVGDITLLLKGTDQKTNTYTVEVMVDDKLSEKKDKHVNEPVQFYTSKARQPYEIVVNQVQKDLIVGYLSTPKEQSGR